MTEKTTPAIRPAPMRRIIAEEITDPEEIQAVTELLQRGDQATRILDHCRSLPEQERLAVLLRLAALVADEDQLDVVAGLLKLAPSTTIQKLEDDLLARHENRPITSSASET